MIGRKSAGEGNARGHDGGGVVHSQGSEAMRVSSGVKPARSCVRASAAGIEHGYGFSFAACAGAGVGVAGDAGALAGGSMGKGRSFSLTGLSSNFEKRASRFPMRRLQHFSTKAPASDSVRL